MGTVVLPEGGRRGRRARFTAVYIPSPRSEALVSRQKGKPVCLPSLSPFPPCGTGHGGGPRRAPAPRSSVRAVSFFLSFLSWLGPGPARG
ncbi:hypothetical protein CALCODRAFT_60582 [Calocera cornea HHB12733]|uniref:Uncharacterized protein n=1 Tax=Calocera cornea HHB12733 TaxID=1353952 RepID=A0A165DN87_9BASI|nr:hypothetical protein CALCODRAFT_60582 [Calocera cornea HHB12733]